MKKNLNKIIIAVLFIFSVFSFTNCKTTNATISTTNNTVYELAVLNMNDTHGALLANKDGIGGFGAISTFVTNVRSENNNVIILHAGDINMGSFLSNMFNAEPDIKCLNQIGIDAATFGNHEFDSGLKKLLPQIRESKFPWVSANVLNGNNYLGKPYIIKKYDGFKVAVIGLSTATTPSISSPDKTVTFKNEISSAKEAVKIVRNKEHADIVILVCHLGDYVLTQNHITSEKIAKEVSGIDLIIDGHTHSFFSEPKIVNNIPIVTANENGKYVGYGIMKIQNGSKIDFNWEPVEMNEKVYPPDSKITKLLAPYIKQESDSMNNEVFTINKEFEFGNKLTRYQEVASGDFVCDSMVYYGKKIGMNIDFSIMNGGSIRSSLPAGVVTRKNLYTMLPFDNVLCISTLKGKDVIDLFDGIGNIKQGSGEWIQVSSEVKYTITYDSEGNGKLSNLTINGNPVDENATYRIATNDYMAESHTNYPPLLKRIDFLNSSIKINDVAIDYASSFKGGYTPAPYNRITVIGGAL